ncbi:MAG: hypothetical protein J2P57_25205, partial [Acidimicrobiaceae bacterium]|nr:hypothetical protein [Acidimicrobiaceae bacterium]
QRHLASLVVPLANVLAGAFALVGASVVFGEGLLPSGWWALPRILGFVAVGGAVVVLCVRPAGAPASHAVAKLAAHPDEQPSEAALWS